MEEAMRSRLIAVARLICGAAALLAAVLFVAGLPAYYERFRSLSVVGDGALRETARENLLRLGLSPEFYAGFYVALAAILAAACLAVGAVIFWRRSDEPMALLVALLLALLGTTFTDVGALAALHPVWGWLGNLLRELSALLVFLFFYLFPDGRFVPRWTLAPAALLAALTAPAVLFPGSPFSSESWPFLSYVSLVLVLLLTGAYAQIYRYRRVSGPLERQQTKWVVFGFTVALAGYAATVSLPAFLPSFEPGTLADLAGAGAAVGFMLLIPLSLGFSILRYRLWEIDLIINRTLVYGTLSVLLAILYSGGVVSLQFAFRAVTGQESQAAVVVSTLAVAALFVPLKRRTQATIDRRFYRRKYDAAKTLRRFAATLRDEVEPEALQKDLVSAVEQTVQPKHVSLWLRPPERDSESAGRERGISTTR